MDTSKNFKLPEDVHYILKVESARRKTTMVGLVRTMLEALPPLKK